MPGDNERKTVGDGANMKSRINSENPSATTITPLRRAVGAIVWTLRLLLMVFVPALLIAYWYRAEYLLPKWREYANRAQYSAERSGVALTVDLLNLAYPTTPAGERAVLEAGITIRMLDWNHPKYFSNTPPAHETTAPLASSQALLKLAENNCCGPLGFLSDAEMRNYVGANQPAIARLMAMPESLPWREIGWRFDAEGTQAFPHNLRSLRDGTESSLYLVIRETSRVLLPGAIYVALADGRTTGAYQVLTGWICLNQAVKGQAITRTTTMVGLAVDGLIQAAADELVRVAPPERDMALRLCDMLDTKERELDYLRGIDAQAAYSVAFLRRAAGELVEAPHSIEGVAGRRLRECNYYGVNALFGPEAYAAVATHVAWASAMHDLIGSRGSAGSASVILFEDSLLPRLDDNPYSDTVRPLIATAVLDLRGRLSQISLLRAALLMRAAQIEAGGDRTKMPSSLAELAKRYGQAPPIDYLAEFPNALIDLEANPTSGTYVLRHQPNLPKFNGAEGGEYIGQWN
jgi:hypothetical protein